MGIEFWLNSVKLHFAPGKRLLADLWNIITKETNQLLFETNT